MWCSSTPDDPAPEASGASDTADASENGDTGAAAPGGAGDGGSTPPAAADSAADAGAADAPAAPAACGPDAVAHCPCAGATVTSEMVMEEPPDRARTRMAVGERVRVTYSLGAADWTIAGEGELSATNGATVTYTAPNTGGDVTLTATGGGCSAMISFTIVEPTSVRMIKRFNSPTRVRHTQNMPNIGMLANIFLAPTDVNFHRVEWKELEVEFAATGVYLCNRPGGNGHSPNPNPLGMTTHVQHGMGTAAAAFDNIYSGHCGAPWTAPQTGTMEYPIPWRWRVKGAAAFRVLTTVHQRFTVDAAGLCTATKAGAIATVLATAPTSTA